MNTLSFGVSIDGANKVKTDLAEIRRMQEQLSRGRSASGSEADLLGGIGAASILRSPDLLNRLRTLTAASGGRTGIPPVIAPPVIPQAGRGLNFAQLAAGAALTPFHPFSAARGISGGLGLGIGGAVPVLAALTAVTVGLTAAFVELKRAVNEGAELYQHAARIGLEVGKTAQLEALSRTIGVSKNELDTLFIQGSHIRHTGRNQGFFQQQDVGVLLGGAGANQLGALQQVKNMSDYVVRTFRDTAIAVRAIADDSKAMQELKYSFGVIGTQIMGIFSDLLTLVFPLIKKYLDDIIALLSFSGNILHNAVQFAQEHGLTKDKGSPGTSHIQAGRAGGSSVSPWERMGFVIGGFGLADFARKTAENTAKIAEHTGKMAERMGGAEGKNPAPDPNHFYLGHKLSPMP